MEKIESINRLDIFITVVGIVIILLFPPLGVGISFLGVLLYLIIGKNRKKRFNSIGIKKPTNWLKTILISLVMGIIIELCFQIFFNPLIEIIAQSKIDLSAYNNVQGNFSNYLIMILIGWIVGGFMEEILFRGFLLTRISNLFNDGIIASSIAIIITSATFGFSHLYQGWSGVLSTGLIAIIFGVIFVKSKKILWYTIFTHGFINVVGLTILYLSIGEKLNTLIFK